MRQLILLYCIFFCFFSYGSLNKQNFAESVSSHFNQVISEKFSNDRNVQNLKEEFQKRCAAIKDSSDLMSPEAFFSIIRYNGLISLLKAVEDYRDTKNETDKKRLEEISSQYETPVYEAILSFIGKNQDIEDDNEEDW